MVSTSKYLFLYTFIALGIVCANTSYACTSTSDNCVEIGRWELGLSLGLGTRSNPILNKEDIPLFILPSVSYYGERFFVDDLLAGYTLFEDDVQMVNAIATVSYDQMYFSSSDANNFTLENTVSGSGSPNFDGISNREDVYTIQPPPEESNMPPANVADSMSVIITSYNLSTNRTATFFSSTSASEIFFDSPVSVGDIVSLPSDNTGVAADKVWVVTEFGDELLLVPYTEKSVALTNIIDISKLSERRMAGLMGLEYEYDAGDIFSSIQLLKDVSGVHGGFDVRTAITYGIEKNNHQINMSVGANWQNSDLLNYYYGISDRDAKATDIHYVIKAGTVSPFVGIEWHYRLTKNMRLRANYHLKKFGSVITNSPLVKETMSTTFFVGGSYSF